MNKRILSIIIFTAAWVSLPLMAQNEVYNLLRFRSGTIYSAEVSTKQPLVQNDLPYAFERPAKPAWAELVVKFDRGRSFSIYDFSLDADGKKYPCYSYAEEEEPYALERWYLKKSNPNKFYRLLFLIDDIGSNESTMPQYELTFRLFKSPIPTPKVPLRNMLDADFTPVNKIKDDGLIGLTNSNLPWNKKTQEQTPEKNDMPAENTATP